MTLSAWVAVSAAVVAGSVWVAVSAESVVVAGSVCVFESAESVVVAGSVLVETSVESVVEGAVVSEGSMVVGLEPMIKQRRYKCEIPRQGKTQTWLASTLASTFTSTLTSALTSTAALYFSNKRFISGPGYFLSNFPKRFFSSSLRFSHRFSLSRLLRCGLSCWSLGRRRLRCIRFRRSLLLWSSLSCTCLSLSCFLCRGLCCR